MRIGISGGTFDPVHKGHIESALAATEQLKLDKVIFVPGGEPPHKLDRRITPARDRLLMLKEAIAQYSNMEISRYETDKKSYSYSIDTVRYFRKEYGPETELFYIIGADVAGELTHWKDYKELFRITSFAALLRPGYAKENFIGNIDNIRKIGADIHLVESPMIDISSNEIRQAVRDGDFGKISNTVPETVLDYIKSTGLYVKDYPFDEEFAKENMQIRLTEERYQHCLRVSEESMRIGSMIGADPEKCRIAGLLHDCGKSVTEHQLHWLDPSLIDGNSAIIHGPAGAIIARKKYGIIDTEILEAIRCHVTGSPDMGPVAQAVFLADYTEPGRVGESFDRIRQALPNGGEIKKSLAEAIVIACEESIKYVLKKGQKLSPQTEATLKSFQKYKEEEK
ncbi:MAG: nicotinate-nucleotide adenylyltransferase [Ruminococcaceae bacterium]|nr:nicotinate-nucleotide adenylyltransferase [Oscillospiraceae bacterium]